MLFSAVTQGALITVEFTAEVTDVREGTRGFPVDTPFFEGKVDIGDIITGTYTYDSSIPDSYPELWLGVYEYNTSPYGISLTIGEFTFETDPENVDFTIKVFNNPPTVDSSDQYLVTSENNLPLPNGVLVRQIFLNLGSDWRPLSSDALPATAPALDDWPYAVVGISGTTPEGGFYIEGEVTSIIPEPTTISLLGLGALALLRRRRR